LRIGDPTTRELRRKERNTVQIDITAISADVANDISTRLASAAAYISGYGSGYESGYQLVSAPYISLHNNERVFPLQETQSPEQMMDRFGFVGNHSIALKSHFSEVTTCDFGRLLHYHFVVFRLLIIS
jgi:hypothetical protein